MIKKFLLHHPVHKHIVPNFDIIFIINPTLFFSVWIMVVVGMICANINMHDQALWITEFSWEICFVFLGLTLLFGASFILIQIADEKKEQENYQLSLIGQHISVDKSQSIVNILLMIGGLITFISNWMVVLPALCIYFLWGIVYNQKSIVSKRKIIFSCMINSFIGALLFTIGWILGIDDNSQNENILFNANLFSYMLPYLLCYSAVAAMVILKNMESKIISNFNESTFFNKYTYFILIVLLMVCTALYLSLDNEDPLASTAILVSLPFFIFVVFRRLGKDVLRAIRYPIFIFNFFALPYYPWLSLPLFCTYYISKYYYWHRFDLHYPTFLVDND